MPVRLKNRHTERVIELRMGCGERLSLRQTQTLGAPLPPKNGMLHLLKRAGATDRKR